MEKVTIRLDSSARHYEAYGREKHANVYFRIDVRPYTDSLNDYSEEAGRACDKAVAAFDEEVVALLKADGWTLRPGCEKYGPGECPQMVKGNQYLYCHPQSISGNVLSGDVERLAAMIAGMRSCDYRWTDNYGDVIITTSADDERQLYCDSYTDSQVRDAVAAVITTKRRNLYKDKSMALNAIAGRLAIVNRRTDLDDIGTGYYGQRIPLMEFVREHYGRLLERGLIKEGRGADGRPLCRFANRAEQREAGRSKA